MAPEPHASLLPGMRSAVTTPEEAAVRAAARMAESIALAQTTRGRAAIALSGGTSPRAAYARLARDSRIDWARVDVFWVDERAVPSTSERSNYLAAKGALLDPANVPSDHVHRMVGEAADLEAAARGYEAELASALPTDDGVPVFDVVVLGVGDDGHTASLFPGAPEVHITDRNAVAVPARAGLEARLTLTARVICAARNIVVIALGTAKKPALDRVFRAEGSLDETPARLIREARGAVTWVIDTAGAGLK